MTHTPHPDHLLHTAYHDSLRRLRALLRDPDDDTPQALARRDNAVIARIAALVPVSPEEVELGAHYIIADDCAERCLGEALALNNSPSRRMGLIAQSARMMREARGYRSLLLRVQAARLTREATKAGRETAEWEEHCALGLLHDALAGPPPPQLEATAADAEPPPPELPSPAPMADAPPPTEPPPATAASRSAPFRDGPGDKPAQRDWTAEADYYAVLYPQRAKLIRSLGRVPKDCSFGPPDPPLVRALVTGTSPILRALDLPSRAAA